MKRFFSEETVLFASVLKWIVLGGIVGIIVGTSTSIFLTLLDLTINFVKRFEFWYFLPPVGLLVSYFIVRYFAMDASGHGTEKVIEAVHKNFGYIKPIVVPVKLIATIITIALGGSAGKEGPCAQIGAGLTTIFANITKMNNQDRKKLVICGISAGFASVFGTPVAGAIFGVEVLYVGTVLYDVLLPSFVAGITSVYIAQLFGINYFFHSLVLNFSFSGKLFLEVIVAGVLFGIMSRLLIESLLSLKRLHERWKAKEFIKAIYAGIFIVIFTLMTSDNYLGLGVDVIKKSLNGEEIVWYSFLMKILFTSITLSFGGSGGIVTPIFFVGATSGNIIGAILGVDRSFTSALGFVALLAGAANTPISASILAIEMFGSDISIYAAIACVVSFVITGHTSVYPSQILAVKKSSSIIIKTGDTIEHTDPQTELDMKNVIKAANIIKDKFKKDPKKDFIDPT